MVEVSNLKREDFQLAGLGLTLAEAKDLLAGIQETMVQAQVAEHLSRQQVCPGCGKPTKLKGHHEITFRSVFGQMKLDSPRFYTCPW